MSEPVEYALAILVIVIALAMIALFATMGELAGRVEAIHGGGGHPEDDPTVVNIDGVKIGRSPTDWLTGLSEGSDRGEWRLLVFSTACATCTQISKRLPEVRDTLQRARVTGIVVSCPDPQRAVQWRAENKLQEVIPMAIDPGGAWVMSNFNVRVSPAILTFSRDQLVAAQSFTSVRALQELEQRIDESGGSANVSARRN